MSEKNDSTSHFDDYGNLITGLAGPIDKDQFNIWANPVRLGRTELTDMYSGSGLNQRIVGKIVDDATRGGFTIAGKTVSIDFETVKSDCEDWAMVPTAKKFCKATRLYGGALLYAEVKDYKDPALPLCLEEVEEFIQWHVIPSFRAKPEGFASGKGLDGYLNPEYYTILSEGGESHKIHYSRVYRLDAIDILDPLLLRFHSGWGPSVLEAVFSTLARLGTSEQYMGSLLHNMSMMLVKIPDLHAQLCGGENQRERAEQAIEAIRQLADNYHWMALGKDDEILEFKRDLSGFTAVSDKMSEAAIRETGMARIIFSGEQAGGLNSNASDEVRGWYDQVEEYRSNILRPLYNWMLQFYWRDRASNDLEILEKWTIEFESLWQESPDQKRNGDKLIADTWSVYCSSLLSVMDAGVYDSREVRALLDAAMKELKMPLDPSQIPYKVIAMSQKKPAPETVTEETTADQEAPEEVSPLPSDPITTVEAAKKWPISTVALNNLCRKGELRHWKVGNKFIISLSEMLNQLQNAGVKKNEPYVVKSSKMSVMDATGQGMGVFIRVPKDKIENLPKMSDGPVKIPHHISLMVFDHISDKPRFLEFLQSMIGGIGDLKITFGETVKSFPGSDAKWVPVTIEPSIDFWVKAITKASQAFGAGVIEHEDFVPHMTVSYEGETVENLPRGSFKTNEIELWGFQSSPIILSLD